MREQLRCGADFIKVMTTGARSVELADPDPAQLSREGVATLALKAARAAGVRIAAGHDWRPVGTSRSRSGE